jgi:hypothetical protein
MEETEKKGEAKTRIRWLAEAGQWRVASERWSAAYGKCCTAGSQKMGLKKLTERGREMFSSNVEERRRIGFCLVFNIAEDNATKNTRHTQSLLWLLHP